MRRGPIDVEALAVRRADEQLESGAWRERDEAEFSLELARFLFIRGGRAVERRWTGGTARAFAADWNSDKRLDDIADEWGMTVGSLYERASLLRTEHGLALRDRGLRTEAA